MSYIIFIHKIRKNHLTVVNRSIEQQMDKMLIILVLLKNRKNLFRYQVSGMKKYFIKTSKNFKNFTLR
jgi:hypothetical protein